VNFLSGVSTHDVMWLVGTLARMRISFRLKREPDPLKHVGATGRSPPMLALRDSRLRIILG
jgi:hypothetical protein